ncbi:nucleotidyltransferase [Clostridium thermosuccinogenes]|uniref:nucleotidyltransferase n=1 Tax=Clostridium thermosuccinogenes TaxID=84032 RepID=UPI000CCC2E5B|nr:nucleotidyltransferase [Pseudoclostridium thermosuccinogenes]PNT93330.1 hypothetical protein CDQ83_07390 [Pseudoclostridium thermosuccinogenes]
MKALGLIVEYNPFHNGHLYHIQQSRILSGCDYLVCVMSGNFIQRGEPALVNKWARARMALMSGADLVLELPAVYAVSSAEYFAYGAVRILDSLGIIDHICFGSENGKIEELDMIADVLHREPECYRKLLKQQLEKGLSYPAAREAALQGYLDSQCKSDGSMTSVLKTSNNILGIEYLKALKKLKSRIIPLTIKRISNTYHTEELTGSISSATAIRRSILSSAHIPNEAEFFNALPEASASILQEEFKCGRGPVSSSNFDLIILSALRRASLESLRKLPYITEGLENRIKNAAENSGTLEEMIDKIATRRYTRTRIQRILFNFLAGLTAQDLNEFNNSGGPQYIRVLGFNRKGREMLSSITRNADLPVIVKAADFKNSDNRLIRRMLEIEAVATDMYVLGYPNPAFRTAGQEFTQNIVIV